MADWCGTYQRIREFGEMAISVLQPELAAYEKTFLHVLDSP
jgi:hypothetical protein